MFEHSVSFVLFWPLLCFSSPLHCPLTFVANEWIASRPSKTCLSLSLSLSLYLSIYLSLSLSVYVSVSGGTEKLSVKKYLNPYNYFSEFLRKFVSRTDDGVFHYSISFQSSRPKIISALIFKAFGVKYAN